MALISPKLAVVSVGISCQAEHQINLNAPMIQKLAGVALEDRGMPFDWIISGALSTARMIERRMFFPVDPTELSADPKPYWGRFGVHFWHSKRLDFGSFTGKHGHLAANWERVRASARCVFILANTQNNIRQMLVDREPIETRLYWDDVARLYLALEREFTDQKIELHVVTRKGLDDPVRASGLLVPIGKGQRARITIHKIGSDASQWAGNGLAWQGLFRSIIP